ncbi:uncharacterized protein LOC134288114 [Aedes albopictus]|uniref:CCHC-type domain-containing protein n=1 Tax=Aedes albopictus TaxID=7160 RepID=A0ABM1YFI8_AEDAL
MGLNEFLECVHHYAESEQMSEAELFSSAMHLFTGNALAWFQAMRSQKRFYNWNHLVCELKANFVHPELDAALRMKASQRRQQRNESFQDFYLEMEKIFRAMPAPLSSHEKLDILKRNLRPDYKQVLVFKPVNTLSELMLIGKTIDASKTSIYQKVFGVPKEVSTISSKPAYDGSRKRQQQQQPRDNGNGYKPRVFYYKNSPPSSPKRNRPPLLRFEETGGRPDKNLREKTGIIPKSPQSRQEGIICLSSLVDKHRPPHLGVCYNCGIQGHEHEKCSKPKRVFCVLCGFKGFEASRCPYCLQNGIRSN